MRRAIKKNLINSHIYKYCKGDLEEVDRVMLTIEHSVYNDRHKLWSRIKNNTSQPSLSEAASIAFHLELKIDDLFEFETIQA